MTITPDLRSGAWLEASFRHARDEYQPTQRLAAELVNANAVADALTTIFSSLSNRQLRETGDCAARWLTDLALCEQEGELTPELVQQKAACQVIVDLAKNSRSVRYELHKQSYRRQ